MNPLLSFSVIASIAWETCRLFEFLMGGPNEARYPWALINNETKEHSANMVKLFFGDPTKRIEDWHESNVQMCLEGGWKWGYIYDLEKKEDPLLTDWEALPKSVRDTQMMFWHTAIALGMETGYISIEDVEAMEALHGEEQATRETFEMAQAIVNPD